MGIYVDDHTSAPGIVGLIQKHGETVIQIRGAFDPFVHEGHIDFIRRARDLVVRPAIIANVNNDAWEERRKRKPYRSEIKRAIRLAEEDMVDYVFVHPSYDIHPGVALAILAKPNIIVREDKSYEGKNDSLIVEEEIELLLQGLGYAPDFRILPRSKYEVSNTELIRMIEERAKGLA